MRLVEQHFNKSLVWVDWCMKAKALYNQCLYYWRQSIFKNIEYFTEYDLVNLMAEYNDPLFRSLPSNTSQQIIKFLFKNIKSWYKAKKEYEKNPNNFLGRPKMPQYKKKYSELHFTTNQVKLKNGFIHFPKIIGIKPIKTRIKSGLKHCRVIPKNNKFVIEFIYEVKEHELKCDNGSYIGLDLGINNLVTCVSTKGNSFIVNGRPLKSINQFFNKVRAKIQSKFPYKIHNSNKLIALTNKRNNRIKDYLHKVSRIIVDYCVSNDINTIVIGKNKCWKNESSMSKKVNQNFIAIPHANLINMIEYKAKLNGINVKLTEESYTSKCSSLDNEPICKHEVYKGKRIKRGLFRTFNGRLVNADCNGALNIIRKVVENVTITDSIARCVEQPKLLTIC